MTGLGVLHEARRTLPPGAIELACHAAVPVALDPGLLHLLRINFFQDPPQALPYEAEALILTSPLLKELGDGLYEVTPTLRDRLLAALIATYGAERLVKVAVLLEQYTNRAGPWPLRELDYAQRLTTLSIAQPERAAIWLEQASTSSADPLAREWFVAMRTRLGQPPDLTAEVKAAVRAGDVGRMGELALLPGADTLALVRHLKTMSERSGPEAAAATATLSRVIDVMPLPRGLSSPIPSAGTSPLPLLPLLGMESANEMDIVLLRQRRAGTGRRQLEVPIGMDDAGTPVYLDLNRPRQGGYGPHAFIFGDTGSGRTEMLRTIVLGLAITHTAMEVQFAFVSPLARAGLAELGRLPHSVAMMTDLVGRDDLRAVLRVLMRELNRRKDLLRVAGYQSRYTYERARTAGRDLTPMPALVIAAHDFLELIIADTFAMSALATIARAGDGVGMHLLFAGQPHELTPLDELSRHISTRIGLRMTPEDSVALFGSLVAANLTDWLGRAVLSRQPGSATPFRVAWVSLRQPPEEWRRILRDGWTINDQTDLAALIRRLGRLDAPAAPIDSLGPPTTLGAVLGPAGPTASRGYQLRKAPAAGDFLPVAVGPDGNVSRVRADASVCFTGPPGSGRSTALESLVLGLALTHTPDELCFFLFSLNGRNLMRLSRLPHVAVAATLADTALIYRAFEEIGGIAERKGRSRHAYVVVDGLGTLLSGFPDLSGALIDAELREPPSRVHVVATGEDHDVEILRHGGIFIVDFGGEAEVAPLLPTLAPDEESAGPDVEEIVRLADQRWSGERPQMRLPQPVLRFAELADARPSNPLSFAIGRRLRPKRPAYVEVDFTHGPGLVVGGGQGCGKTACLRMLATSIRQRYDRDGGARLIVIDPSQSLSDLSGVGMVLRSQAGSQSDHRRLIGDVTAELQHRLPMPNVAAETLRGRVTWRGEEIFLVVDDYQELEGPKSPLRPLVPYLPHAHTVGLHLIVARTVGNRRRQADAFLDRLDELPSSVLYMSEAKRPEPAFEGTPPVPLAPGIGRLVTPSDPFTTVQLAYVPPSEEA